MEQEFLIVAIVVVSWLIWKVARMPAAGTQATARTGEAARPAVVVRATVTVAPDGRGLTTFAPDTRDPELLVPLLLCCAVSEL